MNFFGSATAARRAALSPTRSAALAASTATVRTHPRTHHFLLRQNTVTIAVQTIEKSEPLIGEFFEIDVPVCVPIEHWRGPVRLLASFVVQRARFDSAQDAVFVLVPFRKFDVQRAIEFLARQLAVAVEVELFELRALRWTHRTTGAARPARAAASHVHAVLAATAVVAAGLQDRKSHKNCEHGK